MMGIERGSAPSKVAYGLSSSGEQDFSTGFLSRQGNVTSPIWD